MLSGAFQLASPSAAYSITIYGILYVLVSILVALDDCSGAVLLAVIENPGSVIVVVSSPSDDKGASTVIVVSAAVDGSGAVFLIIVVDKGSGVGIIAITVTVVSWSPITFIVLSVGAGNVVVSFVVVSMNIVNRKPLS